MPKAYYNEFEPYAAQWLRNLIDAGHIAPGDVDERSIVDVRPEDLKGYTQCHFFAGIGGWSYAARIAGWPDERPLWTGSAPCQPFSVAGKQAGQEDDRHLWPYFFDLIKSCRPSTLMGEQVSSAIKFGWIDGVSSDLEAEGYTTGSIIIPACTVDAPHKRDRLWFVANADVACKGKEWEQRSWKFSGLSGDPKDHFGKAELFTSGDGKTRRFEPSIRLLAHGLPARMGRLRAYGNAIVPQVAAEIIKSYMEAKK